MYSLVEFDQADINLIATGSETHLAYSAHLELSKHDIKSNVLSVPSMEYLNIDDLSETSNILEKRKNIFIEAGSQQAWDKMMKKGDIFVGLNGFGASGPGKELYEHFNITVSRIVNEALQILDKTIK